MKIIFEQKKINNGTVKISLDGGVNYEEYEIAEVVESGISIPEDQDLSKVKIKGPANILQSVDVVSSIKIVDMCGLIFPNGAVGPSNNYKNLTSIDIQSGVTEIRAQAFSNCSGLTAINIPDTVTSIGNNAFISCSSLTSIVIPDSVISIGDLAFSRCSSLKSINLPSSITTISDHFFEYCSSLESIDIPNNVTSIGEYAFYGSGIKNIKIPGSVTSIGRNAFRGCSSLTSITIPDSVTFLGGYAFKDCSSLTTIYYTGTQEQWDSLMQEMQGQGPIWNSNRQINVICNNQEQN